MYDKDQIDLLFHWARNVKRAQYAHYRMADRYGWQYRSTGITTAVITVICGSSILLDLPQVSQAYEAQIKLIIALAILFASALSGIHTFLKLDERALGHKKAGAAYSALKRQIDQLIAAARSKVIDSELLNAVREKIDYLGANTPQVDDNLWKAILKKMPPLDFDYYQIEKHFPK